MRTTHHNDDSQDDLGMRAELSQLLPHPENYNRHPQAELDAIKASLLRFGQRKSIVVQRCAGNPPRFLILAGHGTVEAVQQILEENPSLHSVFSSLKIDIVPDDWTPAQAKGYMLADNETAKKAAPDSSQLARLLQEQLDAGQELISVGSSEDELHALLERLGDEILAADEDDEDASYTDPDAFEEEDEFLDLTGDGDKRTENLVSLRFGKHNVPLSSDEFLQLEERLKLYQLETGSNYGFIRALFK